VAELDALFAEAVQALARPERTRLHVDLVFSPGNAARAAELTARENGCCSFFTLTVADGSLALEVTVPAKHVEVLDALQARASVAAFAAQHIPGARNVAPADNSIRPVHGLAVLLLYAGFDS
jgi:hypothetical protein